jgi:hypothetical protein
MLELAAALGRMLAQQDIDAERKPGETSRRDGQARATDERRHP